MENRSKKFMKFLTQEQSLGKTPSSAIGVVTKPGTSYKLDVPTIPKRRKKRKKHEDKPPYKLGAKKIKFGRRHFGGIAREPIGKGKKLAGIFGISPAK